MISGIIKYLHKGNKDIVISYKALRRLIGFLGMLLPIILILGGWLFAKDPIQQSISLYYYSNMRDFLVGTLFVVALFLMTYKGTFTIDNIVATITGIAGLCVAIFPCFNELYETQRVGIFQMYPDKSNIIHLTFASIFFILLAINSIFLFTRKSSGDKPQKLIRNKIYIICGIIILACFLGLIICMLTLSQEQKFNTKIILILEAIALWAFGVSWLVKGETIFTDK
ncbi:MAG: hypothetical protein EHM93_17065 [Bacteroidales bacterium]|nr:MAG: hypothetical protein EHM93_17065 [Bacteroidales bacterium]